MSQFTPICTCTECELPSARRLRLEKQSPPEYICSAAVDDIDKDAEPLKDAPERDAATEVAATTTTGATVPDAVDPPVLDAAPLTLSPEAINDLYPTAMIPRLRDASDKIKPIRYTEPVPDTNWEEKRHVQYEETMQGFDVLKYPMKEHKGFVSLVDVMPRKFPVGRTADYAIAQAARVSYRSTSKSADDDRTLIRRLMRDSHSSPWEMAVVKFHVKAPMFVARQWMRHRMASINEVSARYTDVKDQFFEYERASDVRRQSRSNKQGSETNGFLEQDVAEDFINGVDHINEIAYEYYLDAIHAGVSREQARILLPQTMMVEWYWKIDLHNLFHFLELRMDSHAQKEIRDYAKAVFELLKVVFPVACEAFEDYRLGGMWLSRFEVEAIRNKQERIESSNQTEQNAWFEKKRQLNL